ncbi:GNAT family N-acetyltransferase [Chloroflexota bacterium]
MILLAPEQISTLKSWFLPERPGPVIGSHVIQTGNGTCFANRWPSPQVILIETAGNFALLGNPQAINSNDIKSHIKGFVATSPLFLPTLKAAFPDLGIWKRIIFTQRDASYHISGNQHTIRRLAPSDTHHLQELSTESAWISKTWGGPVNLAASGFGWGAFVDGQLASVACTFFLGETYEDIGVVTEPRFQGLGLSTACVESLCQDIRTRNHQPSWTTSPDNLASRRVAEKLGFTIQRHDLLYVVGVPIPEPIS